MKKAFKTIISFMLAVIVVVGVIAPIAPIASALKISNFYTDSDIWLVDSNTHSTSSTIYLYGRADYLCLKLKQTDAYKDIFYFRLYSDSKKNNEVLSYSTEYSTVGTKYITLPISFDDLKSGTYYAETYVYKRCLHGPTGVQLSNSYVPRDVDEDTRRTYKVVINKKGTSINEMNTVMYGYENTEKGPKIYWYSVPGATGYYLAEKLIQVGINVKIIEQNAERCDELCQLLPKATIINGDGTDNRVLLEEGIERAQSFVALTNIDEENIMLSLFVKSKMDGKLITKINRITYDEIINKLDLDTIIYPKNITAEYIVRFVRAKKNSLGSNIETMHLILDGKVEALEFRISEGSPVLGKTIESMNIRKNVLIACINRNGKIITPRGYDVIMKGDTVIVVTTITGLQDIGDILE